MAPGVLVQPPAIAELRPDSGRYSRDRSPVEKLAQDRREKQDLAIFNPVSSKSLKTMHTHTHTERKREREVGRERYPHSLAHTCKHTDKLKDRRDTHT